MEPYILCIAVSLLFAFFSQKLFESKKNKFAILFLIISFLFPCIISGCRTILTGRDITVYVLNNYDIAINSNSIISYLKKIEIEPFFGIAIYIGSRFKDIHYSLFFIQLFIEFPLFLYTYMNRKEKKVFLVASVYLLTVFCNSLNIMMQMMAVAYTVLGFYFFKNKRYKSFMICFFLSIMSHTSAIITIIIYLIEYIYDCNKFKDKIFYFFIIVCCVGAFSLLLDKLIMYLPDYSMYLTRKNTLTISNFMISSVKKLFWIIIGLVCLFTYDSKNSKRKEVAVPILLLVVDLILSFACIKISSAGRIGYYFLYLGYFELIPYISNSFVQKKSVNFAIFCILFIFWINMTINDATSNIVPYRSDVINFLNSKELIINE